MSSYNVAVVQVVQVVPIDVEFKGISVTAESIKGNESETLNLLYIELIEINNDLDIYGNVIKKLERHNEINHLFEKLVTLHQSIYVKSTVDEKKTLLLQLKADIDHYEAELLKLFMASNRNFINEEIMIEEHRSDKLKREINMLVEKVKFIEPNYQFNFDIQQEVHRLELIHDEIKVVYVKLKKQKLLKEELLTLVSKIDNPDLKEKVFIFLQKVEIEREEYLRLKEEIRTYHQHQEKSEKRKVITHIVIDGLQSLGYEIVDEDKERLKAQEEVLIDLEDDYKLKVIFQENNSYKIRFIKQVLEGSELSQNEQQRDKEVLTKWCREYDTLVEFLAQNGLEVTHKIKLEPDVEDIEYVVVPNIERQPKSTKQEKLMSQNVS